MLNLFVSMLNCTYTCVSVKKGTNFKFTAKEECKFQTRYENGYDLPDERYIQWLRKHHPSSAKKLSSKNGTLVGLVL